MKFINNNENRERKCKKCKSKFRNKQVHDVNKFKAGPYNYRNVEQEYNYY